MCGAEVHYIHLCDERIEELSGGVQSMLGYARNVDGRGRTAIASKPSS